ncbi:MAG TPA: filamentous hemagglutinin N-terminal domain-containing protein, partial [Methylococcaceae bacterium]|nr:filamentous hemagglutinin N-terminal domain-containing protein [Methylococcaceae bacterium]
MAVLVLAALAAPAGADVTSSGLNTVITLRGSDYDITGGTPRGSNLFHSFGNFSIAHPESATFNSMGYTNIIGRVTGGNVSNIDGTINSASSANLYLVNPAGMVFGPNAELHVNGSFHASTADYVAFQNGERFYADTNNANTVLSTAPPASFGFLSESAAPIRFDGARLGVSNGNGLHFSAGDITIANDAELSAEGGGKIELDAQGTLTLTTSSGSGSRVTTSPADLAGAQAGDIEIRARDVVLENGGQILATTSGAGDAGNIFITADGTVHVGGESPDGLEYSRISSSAEFASGGDGGNITIQAREVVVKDGGQIQADTEGDGYAGDISITAAHDVLLENAAISTSSNGRGPYSWPWAPVPVMAEGDAGDISITAGNRVRVDNGYIGSVSGFYSWGAPGIITVNARDVAVENGGRISANSYNWSNGGIISIAAADAVRVSGAAPDGFNPSEISVSVGTFFLGQDQGDAGGITIRARDVAVADGGRITAFAGGNATGGDISITADTVRIGGVSPDGQYLSMIDSSVWSSDWDSEGDGGSITIQARDVAVKEGVISAGTWGGGGNAGDISIYGINGLLAEKITLHHNGEIRSSAGGDALGNGGNITLFTRLLNLDEDSSITATNEGFGDAGSITINSPLAKGEEVNLSGNSRISVASAFGNAGNISVFTNKWLYMLDSLITTSAAGGLGNGGNILIDPQFVILNNSQIIANALQGQGGNITIITQFLLQSTNSS